MSWTLAQLAAAVAALPAGTTDADAATSLAARTTTATNQPFALSSAISIAITSPNMSWARIVQRAKGTASFTNGQPTGAADIAVLAAITVTEMSPAQMIDPTVTAAWAAWQGGLEALQAVGDLSAADVALLGALPNVVSPTWDPTPSQYDVAAARGGA